MTVRMTLNLQYTSTEEHFVSEGHVDMPTLQLGFITIARKKLQENQTFETVTTKTVIFF